MKFILSLALLAATYFISAQTYEVSSPNNQLKATVQTDNGLSFSVILNGTEVISNTAIGLDIEDYGLLGSKSKVKSVDRKSVNESLIPVVQLKSSSISNNYNELIITYKDGNGVTFRAFDDGLAYKFFTNIIKDIQINDEQFDLSFTKPTISYFPQEESLISHYERTYKLTNPDTLNSEDFCSLPVLFQTNDINVLLTETDLYDYPGLFMKGTNSNGLASKFAPYVLEAKPDPERTDRNQVLTSASYIAKTTGKREYPWRVMVLTSDDADLVNSQLTYTLSRENESTDTDWIKPGKVAWDWYNANNIYNVDFEAGINTETYKYYIDFAAKYGLEYVILDEGWSKTTTNIREFNPDIDVNELIAYGKEKNVGIILWLLWGPLDNDLEALKLYKDWGVKGIKVDFMQRADQYMVNYYERVAKAAYKNHLLVDYHGAYKPAGLRRKYPNVISYEGVRGNETNKWDNIVTPEHNLLLPFIRMVAGPMDYTPGAMSNGTELNHVISFYRPMALGTRSHEMAMYVVFESPLQMLCDSPTEYYKEPKLTELISKVPTVWDESRVLEAKVGDYIVMARRKGTTWYLGAMTDWTAREFEVDLSFLGDGNYSYSSLQDGPNAHRHAEDYVYKSEKINANKKLSLKLASGGGYLAIIEQAE